MCFQQFVIRYVLRIEICVLLTYSNCSGFPLNGGGSKDTYFNSTNLTLTLFL